MPTSTPLPCSSPESQGLSSRAVLAWLDALAADDLELHSFMLLRRGTVVAEGWWAPYSSERVHRLHSLSKSFTATAIGLLVAEGPQGINAGGWGLYLSTEGVARFGQLYLQRGHWEGEQVLPEAWVEEATRAQVPPGDDRVSDWSQGYGFQFWRCRHAAYRGDGAFGQFCVVMPGQEAVLAITANVQNMQRLLDHVWTGLLPAMSEGEIQLEDADALETLRARCTALHLDIPAPGDEMAEGWNGAPRDETYTFGPNEAGLRRAQLTVSPTSCHLTVTDNWGEHALDFGLGDWHEGKTTLWSGSEEAVLAQAGWQRDGTLALMVVFIEGGFCWAGVIDERADTLTTRLSFTPGSEGELLLARREGAGLGG